MNTKNSVKAKVTGVLVGVASLLMAGLVNASTVSVNPNVVNTAPGDSFSAVIQANFSDVTGGVSEGAFQLSWDPTLLALQTSTASTDITNVLLTQFLANGGDAGFTSSNLDAVAGTLDFGFTLCPLAFPCDFLSVFDMLNVTFDVLPSASGVTSAALSASFLGDFGQDGVAVTAPTFNGATVNINAVPVPAAIWLFGSGLIGMIAISRRRKPQLVC